MVQKLLFGFTFLAVCFFQCQNTSSKVTAFEEAPQVAKHFKYDFDTTTHSIQLKLSEQGLFYFQEQPKKYTYYGAKPPKNWKEPYFNMFLKSEKDEKAIQDLIQEINQFANHQQEQAEHLIAFVQNGLSYDWLTYRSEKPKMKYPYETLFLQKGVCSDKSFLLVKALSILGFDVCLMEFETAEHMGVGIRSNTDKGSFGTPYLYIETTNTKQIGTIPEVINGKKLQAPTLIFCEKNGSTSFDFLAYTKKTNEQSTRFGEDYLNSNAYQRKLLFQMSDEKQRRNDLFRQLNVLDCDNNMTKEKLEQCNQITQKINDGVERYNSLVQKYNATIEN